MQPYRTELNRRDALRAGLIGSAVGLLAGTSFADGIPAAPKPKLLLVFLRGGYDAVNTVLPVADAGYTQPIRRLTYIQPIDRLPIPGTTSWALNPGLLPLLPTLLGGRLVFLHATGDTTRTGSHFTDQQTWETGIDTCTNPGPSFNAEEGWVTRAANVLFSPGFQTACVSDVLQQFFQTRNPSLIQAHVRRIRSFPNDATTQYSLSSLKPALDPKHVGASLGLRKLFGLPAIGVLDTFSRKAGIAMLDSEEQVFNAAATGYTPLGGAKYPFGKAPNDPNYPFPSNVGLASDSDQSRIWFQNLRDAMWLLRKTSARVVGVHIGGFDTHSAQGSNSGQLFQLLQAVAYGLNSVDKESQAPQFANEVESLTTLVVSEFGRTSAANDSEGTDHGGATCVWAMGSRVLQHPISGPIYNGIYGLGGTWPGMFSGHSGTVGCNLYTASNTFVQPVTDFRVVFREVLEKVLSATPTQVNQIIPNATGFGPMLGFL
jgi:uncharacterized protein (DUF1501 family)